MDLTLGCPGSDGPPGDEVGKVLGRYCIEKLNRCWDPVLREFEEELSCKEKT